MRDRDAIYQDILECGRKRMERASRYSDQTLVQIERAHLALIPHLLRCADERRHRHYLEIDRPRFLRYCKHKSASEFEPFWLELTAHLTKTPAPEVVPTASIAGPVVLHYRGDPKSDGDPPPR
jgi:hypothetical protein